MHSNPEELEEILKRPRVPLSLLKSRTSFDASINGSFDTASSSLVADAPGAIWGFYRGVRLFLQSLSPEEVGSRERVLSFRLYPTSFSKGYISLETYLEAIAHLVPMTGKSSSSMISSKTRTIHGNRVLFLEETMASYPFHFKPFHFKWKGDSMNDIASSGIVAIYCPEPSQHEMLEARLEIEREVASYIRSPKKQS